MAHRRKDDDDVEFSDTFSTDRYFYSNGGWYYYARGMFDGGSFIFGPYSTKDEAIYNCNERFLSSMNLFSY